MPVSSVLDAACLRQDFYALCDAGGRFAGTPSELAARRYVTQRLVAIANGASRSQTYPYDGWRRIATRAGLAGGRSIDATSLVLSPPVRDAEFEVVDLGRGTFEEFERERGRIAGRAVLVRHEFPFSVQHVHRRRKYAWAKEAAAAAFCIANYLPGVGVVAGSSGRGEPGDIPAVGLSYEGGQRLAQAASAGPAGIRLTIESERAPMEGAHVIFELPGTVDEWVVVCAHLDGHDLADSALDNATGAAAVLAIAQALASAGDLRRGVRCMLFTFEEWGLYGSSVYVQGLSEEERRKIALVVNLDTICGAGRLSVLVSGMDDVAAFIGRTTDGVAMPIDVVAPVMANSDHYNFFLAGIPSFRLIAGYEDPTALTRFLLTPADRREIVDLDDLRVGAEVALRIAHAAARSAEPIARHRSAAEVRALLDLDDPWVSDRMGAS